MTTKKTIIKGLANKLDYLTEEDAAFAVNSIINSLTESLTQGSRVEIRGFGSFSIRERKYAKRDEFYNTVYYRMSKLIFSRLNPELAKDNTQKLTEE